MAHLSTEGSVPVRVGGQGEEKKRRGGGGGCWRGGSSLLLPEGLQIFVMEIHLSFVNNEPCM